METVKPLIKLDIDLDEDSADAKDNVPKIELKTELNIETVSNVDEKKLITIEVAKELPTLNTLRDFNLETEVKQEVLSDDDIPLSELPKFESEVYVGYSSETSDSDDDYFGSNAGDVAKCTEDESNSQESFTKHKKSKKKKSKKSKDDKVKKKSKKNKKKKAKKQQDEQKEEKPPREKGECKLCNAVFGGLKEFRRHTRTHFSTLICPICLEQFVEIPQLREHVDSHITNYNCKKCGQGFIRNSNLTRHEKICTPDQTPLLCPDCGKHFQMRRQFKQHLVLHNAERPFKCKFCPKAFRINSRLMDHEKTHVGMKPFKCHLCGKPFHSASDMKKHVKRHENPHFNPVYVDKDRNRITHCSICNEEVINIRKHMEQHYQAYGYSCGVCGKSLKSYKALLSHIKIHEGNPWECDICLRRFNRKNNMLMHRERHSMEGYRAKIKQKDLANQRLHEQLVNQYGGSLTKNLTSQLTSTLASQILAQMPSATASPGPTCPAPPMVTHQISKLI